MQYLDLVLHLLDVVADAPESELSLPQKINFIHEAQQTFGRTALVLGGGAAFGMPAGRRSLLGAIDRPLQPVELRVGSGRYRAQACTIWAWSRPCTRRTFCRA